jgi:hypothetical protein
VDSRPGEGSRFTVELPIRHPNVPPPEPRPGQAPNDLVASG